MSNTRNNNKISVEQIHFLEKEMIAYSKNPSEGSTWKQIKKRIKNKTSASLCLRGKKA